MKCGVKPLISTVRNKRPTDKSLVCVLITASFCTALILTRGKRPCHRWKCTTLRLYWDKQVYKARAAWVWSQPCVNQGYLRRHKTAEDDTVSDGVSHESRERRSERPDHSYQRQTPRSLHVLDTQRHDEHFYTHESSACWVITSSNELNSDRNAVGS